MAYRQQQGASLSRGQRRVMSAIERCRTAARGGHLEPCDSCGPQRPTYNSCRNRHCPQCQSLARAQWLQDRQAEWVVYAKPPFGGPRQVLDYLGRYTHRVAISNHRLRCLQDAQVTFQWKDYRHRQRLTLEAGEFIPRFLLHVLPQGFQRIRYYGFLAPRHRSLRLSLCRRLLGVLPDLLPLAHSPTDYRDRYE